MRTKGTAAELEARRRLAVALLLDGKTNVEVMATLGVLESSVKRWKRAVREGGLEALAARPHPGPRPRLDARQKTRLVKLLAAGPLAAGYLTNVWTCSRVKAMILRHFGVTYYDCHVWRLLRQLKWTPQKPCRRALKRNEAAIDRWHTRDWPRIKKERRAAS